ncbi:MAG TPA: 2Fe-2S iron-sulfur cluster-binding protein [Phycisphaerales bacterium]|nr:2Fe-2S iron-sulfur cluster-binding protein [Phycisphaerales bacterium]HRQ76727.1 2Fe-2S iron-sulfur cluster-binding protein [Phycisphaerales bacterium]
MAEQKSPTITINGKALPFTPGQTILQVALDNDIEIPHYCYHPGISIAANCRICLAEVWAPNPRNDNKLEPIPKLLPTCQQPAADGNVVYTDSPKAIANQKAVMEYLLINHPVDCAICDQAGECHLQDYSYQYGRGQARFQEQKIKQPKKDVGPHVLLYSDRCIMCTRCVRFTREVTGTGELIVDGRGAMEQIDVFPGKALDNELSANVIDLCPVGALLDKDFLFQQRVWFLTKTPSIDGITASGDNISIEHNKGVIYRIKPRTNLAVNRWWITDEVRYGWKFVHSEDRLRVPFVKGEEPFEMTEAPLAYEAAYAAINERFGSAKRIAAMLSPMLSCEDAYLLATYVLKHDPDALLAVGPVPFSGEDKTFKDGFKMYAEKAPNARGVRRVLNKLTGGRAMEYGEFIKKLAADAAIDAVLLTGNYPSTWATDALLSSLGHRFVAVIDTLRSKLVDRADVLLPSATWTETAGTFENANNRLQAFERAINPIDYCKTEAQLALDLLAEMEGAAPTAFNAANTRRQMADMHGMTEFVTEVHLPEQHREVEPDMQVVEL